MIPFDAASFELVEETRLQKKDRPKVPVSETTATQNWHGGML